MNVLHLFPESETVIARHVAMIEGQSTGQGESAEVPDIVHVHGCWNRAIVRRAERLHRLGARLVLSPHEGLQPWMIRERRLQEKLAKTLLWQRRMVARCYAVIAHGVVEADNLTKLGWNPRIETIGNAVISNGVTPDEMRRLTQAVYQKVMDSNTIELLDDEARQHLVTLIKAGTTGDRRWVAGRPVPSPDETEWRRLLLYADHENIRDVIDSGVQTLGIVPHQLQTSAIASYLPTSYHRPTVKAIDAVGIVTEMRHTQLTLLQLVELDKALHRPDVEDDSVIDTLAGKRLTKYFQRLLQLLGEQTGLDEGFMPLSPLDDKQTQILRNRLANHLKI